MSGFSEQHPVIFGEVLYDRFPDGSVVLGGAPFNVAWHLQAFGVAPLFVSRVGDDALGRSVRNTMIAWEMDTSGLQLDPVHPTGSVIARPDGRYAINPTGSPALASAGTGDSLAGMIAALLAQCDEPLPALHAAVWLHGAAADDFGADIGLVAGDIAPLAARRLARLRAAG